MAKDMLAVADDVVVAVDYILTLEDGEEVDRSDKDDPMVFLQGHGQIIPGLEKALYGMRLGEEKSVIVQPEDAYGEYDPENFERLPRSEFPVEMELEVGMILELHDDSGEVFEVEVIEVLPEHVVLDMNHPMAGEALHFQVRIAGLRAATLEELAHGHVHGPGGAH
jgi:FKBP-type peptidyl-prolyl cis-trans isomerase SlyD